MRVCIAFSQHANHPFEIAAGLDLSLYSGIACVGEGDESVVVCIVEK